MKPFTLLFCCCLPLIGCSPKTPNPQVILTTPMGNLTAEIYVNQAPISGSAFMRNVDAGIYNDGRAAFYRVVRMDNQPHNDVKIEIIQGGVDKETGDTSVPYIPHETTEMTGLTHRNGTLSLARMEPGTANSEFAICIGDQPAQDFEGGRSPDGQGFAVFGQITQGMDIVRRIQQLPDTGQYLNQPISITSIHRK